MARAKDAERRRWTTSAIPIEAPASGKRLAKAAAGPMATRPCFNFRKAFLSRAISQRKLLLSPAI